MTPWYKLWTHQVDIAMGAPEVVARRVSKMVEPGAMWSTDQWLESQRMVLEKWEAAWRAWWATYGGASWPRLSTPLMIDWTRHFSPHATTRAVRSANRALSPYSSRVKANAKRLRSKRKA